ncbi:MAG: hypothetical protein ACRER4_00135 [Steroidobacteraceae bacterium]
MKKFTCWLAGGLATLALIGAATVATGETVTQAQIEAATTVAQHEAIAQSYEQEAAASEKKAESHAKMAQTYRLGPNKAPGASMANHCERIEKDLRSAASEYRMLAKEHREMAAKAN